MTINLTHTYTVFVKELSIFDNVNAVKDMMESIASYRNNKRVIDSLKHAVRFIEPDEDDPDFVSKQLVPEEIMFKFKGEVFEVFVEFFFKHYAGNKNVTYSVENYRPEIASDDFGVDGLCDIVRNGKYIPGTIQAKYRSNTNKDLTRNEIATFLAESFNPNLYGVEERNMIVITTAKGANHVIENRNPELICIGYKTLCELVDSFPTFWDNFREAIQSYHNPKSF